MLSTVKSGWCLRASLTEAFASSVRPSAASTWIDYHIGHARAWLGDGAGAQASLHRYIAANPQDTCGYLMLAVIHGFAGRTEDARRALAEAVGRKANIDQDQVRGSNRYRDPVRLERVIAVLNAAGLPA